MSPTRSFTFLGALLFMQCCVPSRPRCQEVTFGESFEVGVGALNLSTTSTANRIVLGAVVAGPDGGLRLIVSSTDGQARGSESTIAPMQSGSRFSLSAGQIDVQVAWSSLDAGVADLHLAALDELGQPRFTDLVGSAVDVQGTLPQVAANGDHVAVLWDPGAVVISSPEWALMLSQRDKDGVSRVAEIGHPLDAEAQLFLREGDHWALYYWQQTTQSGTGVVKRQAIDDSGAKAGEPTTVQTVGTAGQFLQLTAGRGDEETLVVVSFQDQTSRKLLGATCRASKCGAPSTIWNTPVAPAAPDRREVSIGWVLGAYWVAWQHEGTGYMAYVRSDLSLAAGPLALPVEAADGLSIREAHGAAFAAWRTPGMGSLRVAPIECVESH